MNSALTIFVIMCAHCGVTSGHGRLMDPPSRASMWRYGFENPPNYDDTALYCGGFSAQWEVNGGRCGVCGDRYDGLRDHEAGGKYANGIIVRHYREGEVISVSVDLTTSHLGYFEFRLCPNNNPRVAVTQQCLDRYLLQQLDGSTRYPITTFDQGVRTVRLVLPRGLTCTQCVLQWKYNTGNSWRCEGQGVYRRCCDGCGPQEQFYACADVDITSASGGSGNQPTVAGTGLGGLSQAVVVSGTYTVPITQYAIPNTQYVRTFGSSAASYVSQNSQHVNVQYGLASQYFYQEALRQPTLASFLSPYYSQCHGLFESLTDDCRRTCSTGVCSTVYCSEECQLLPISPKQTQ